MPFALDKNYVQPLSFPVSRTRGAAFGAENHASVGTKLTYYPNN